jgi:hypothetical protein
MNIINNVFSNNQLNFLHKVIPTYKGNIDNNLGRIIINDIKDTFNKNFQNKLTKIAIKILNEPATLDHACYVKYSNEYGSPNLPPHFDGDTNDLIVNFQLSSNTSWDLGLNLKTYTIKDNSALIFNGNTNIHWRPHKIFNDGEYVQMIFFRFYKTKNRSNYSYLPINQTDEIFSEVKKIRNSLNLQGTSEMVQS